MINQKFGRLFVIEELEERSKDRHILYKCICDCGNERVISGRALRYTTRSCGCITIERLKKDIRVEEHPLYNTWLGMRARCLNPNHHKYKNYGGRGIRISDAWNNFYTFVNDMGEKPKGYSLDRIDNDGDYCKENCKWSSPVEQANNRRKRTIVKMY